MGAQEKSDIFCNEIYLHLRHMNCRYEIEIYIIRNLECYRQQRT